MPKAQLGECEQPVRVIIDDPANKYMSQVMLAGATDDCKDWQVASALPTGSIVLSIFDPSSAVVLEQYLVSLEDVIKSLFLARIEAQAEPKKD